MKRLLYILTILLLLGCQSIEQLSIDYMQPADVSFPNSLRRIGIVNNCLDKPHISNGKLTAEALAEAIANENYFDEVIICDSVLRANDTFERSTMLSQAETQMLTEVMGVDFIIAVEEVVIKTKKQTKYMADWGGYVGTTSAIVSPKFTIYLPTRQKPLVSLQPCDSIFWNRIANNQKTVQTLFPSDSVVHAEASTFAGQLPIKHILPYWTTSNRYYFTNGNVAMRDAAVYVKEEDWQGAINLWREVYDNQKKSKLRMQAAFNLALGYEMLDMMQEAYDYAIIAQQLAYEIENVKEKEEQQTITPDLIPYYIESSRLVNELKTRKDGMVLLKSQMQRFETDF